MIVVGGLRTSLADILREKGGRTLKQIMWLKNAFKQTSQDKIQLRKLSLLVHQINR